MPFLYKKLHNLKEIINQYELLPVNFPRSIDVNEKMKAPSTVERFILILADDENKHGLTFSESEEERARIFFNYNNYYNFSIFPKILPPSVEKYTFSDAFTLFRIDEFIRKEVHYFTARIEKWIKTSLAYHLSHSYEGDELAKAECYLDPNMYNSSHTYRDNLVNFHNTLIDSKEPFIKHHFQRRNGCIPIWVLVETLTFGQIDTFISGLNSKYKNIWIENVFGKENRKFILSWISVARYLRNIAAHHGRFYGKSFTVLPKLKREQMKQFEITNSTKNTLFVSLLVIASLLEFHNNETKKEWNTFIDSLDELVSENQEIIDYPLNGFVDKWSDSLKANIKFE